MNMMEAARKQIQYTSRDHQAYKNLLRTLIVQVSRAEFKLFLLYYEYGRTCLAQLPQEDTAARFYTYCYTPMHA
jgi:hypothetical protein